MSGDIPLILIRGKNMQEITLRAFAKINLSIDVLGLLENGYHQVEMIMQQIYLHDLVSVRWQPDDSGEIRIRLFSNKKFLPTDERNIAYKAALAMSEKYGKGLSGEITVRIKKMIPVAAGLAGGSGNGAAVILGLNHLWQLKRPLKELMDEGAKLGADVPFSMMGQAKCNKVLGNEMNSDPDAACCALAFGTGTELKPIKKTISTYMVLSKPAVSVSTAEIYKGIDDEEIVRRPDNRLLMEILESEDDVTVKKEKLERNMVNVLETVTAKRYPLVMYTKDRILKTWPDAVVFMSGSGPTMFTFTESENQAKEICEVLKRDIRETFWTRTMV